MFPLNCHLPNCTTTTTNTTTTVMFLFGFVTFLMYHINFGFWVVKNIGRAWRDIWGFQQRPYKVVSY